LNKFQPRKVSENNSTAVCYQMAICYLAVSCTSWHDGRTN